MRASACVWWAKRRGGREGVLGRVPSWAVDGSVGRFKGRHFANSEAVGLIFPPFLLLEWEILLGGVGAEPRKEIFCWVSVDAQTQEKCVCQVGAGPGEGGKNKGGETEGQQEWKNTRGNDLQGEGQNKERERRDQVDRGELRFCVEGQVFLPSKCQN